MDLQHSRQQSQHGGVLTATHQRYDLLCVDSPKGLTREPAEALTGHGIEIRLFRDGVRALLGLSKKSPAAVLIPTDAVGVDLGTFVEAVARDCQIPVIVGFTQEDSSPASAYAALESGACALVALPFAIEALMSAMRAIGPKPGGPGQPIAYGAVQLFGESHEVYVDGGAVRLSPKEFRTVELLLSAAPRVVTVEEIAGVLGEGAGYDPLRVRKHMQRLRYKLDAGRPGDSTVLKTLKGVGYRLAAESYSASASA